MSTNHPTSVPVSHPSQTPISPSSPSHSSSSSSSSPSTSAVDLAVLSEAVSSTGTSRAHAALVQALRLSDDLTALRAARRAWHIAHPLPSSAWSQWLSDERSLAHSLADQSLLINLSHDAIHACPTVSLCQSHLDLHLHLVTVSHPRADPHAAFEDIVWLGATTHPTLAKLLISSMTEFDRTVAEKAFCITDTHPLFTDAIVFEKRLTTLSYAVTNVDTDNDHHDQEDLVATYRSYAAWASPLAPLLAIGVFERLVTHVPTHASAWRAYLAHVDGDSRRLAHVARRAIRAVPTLLSAWTAAVSTVTEVEMFIGLLSKVTPVVIESHDLSGAAELTRAAWTSWLALKMPDMARKIVRSTLDFNVVGTAEWGSALVFAAKVMTLCGDVTAAREMMESVVTSRAGEPRWWLAYVGLREVFENAQETRDVYERAVNAVPVGAAVDVVRDMWATFEVGICTDDVQKRLRVVEECMRKRRDTSGGAMFPAGGEERNRPERKGRQHKKRRRGEDRKGQQKGHDEKIQKADNKQVAGKEQNTNDNREDIERKGAGRDPSSHLNVEQYVKETGADAMEDVPGDGATMKTSVPEVSDTASTVVPEAMEQVQRSEPANTKAGREEGGGNGEEEEKREVEPRTIFLSNLPYSAGDGEVREALGYAGEIVRVQVLRRSDGASKGMAYVEFGDESSVDKALERKSGPILGRTVSMARSRPPGRRGGRGRGARGGRGRGGRGRGSRGRGRSVMAPRSVQNRRLRLDTNSKEKDVEMGDVESMTGIEAETEKEVKPKSQDDFRRMLMKDNE